MTDDLQLLVFMLLFGIAGCAVLDGKFGWAILATGAIVALGTYLGLLF